jgi:AraC-like DNA-binding protein
MTKTIRVTEEERTSAADRKRPSVVCLLPDEARLYVALRAASRLAITEGCRRIEEFRDACARLRPVGAVIVALKDVEGRTTMDAVRAVKAGQPTVVVIALCGAVRGEAPLLVDFIRDGADILVREGVDDLRVALDGALDERVSGGEQSLVPRVARQLGPAFAVSEQFVRSALLDRGLTRASTVARTIGVSRRTLSARFLRHGLPAPAMLLMRLRLLYAVHAIGEQRKPVGDAVTAANFGSPPALRAALRRHFSMSMAEAKRPSATDAILSMLTVVTTSARRSQ